MSHHFEGRRTENVRDGGKMAINIALDGDILDT
jgi:hypothetical protein